MAFSRRAFLKAAALAQTSFLFSPSAFSCGSGPDRERAVLEPAPPFDFLSDGFEDGIEQFLNQEYGPYWVYSNLPMAFSAPYTAEYHRKIPFEILPGDSSLTGRYRSITIFFQRFIHLSKHGESCSSSCPPNRSVITRVAKFDINEDVLPYLRLRIQVPYDSREIRLFAVLHEKKFRRIEVVKQNGSTKLRHCYFEIDGYIDERLGD